MSFIQKLLKAVLPDAWAKSMEAESREWRRTYPCGHARSVWDLGGIRWKAAGNPRQRVKCPKMRPVDLAGDFEEAGPPF